MKIRWKKMCLTATAFCGLNLLALAWAEAKTDEVLREKSLEFGRELHRTAQLMEELQVGERAGQMGRVHELWVNGAEVRLHSGSMPVSSGASLQEMVGRVRESCQRRSATERAEELVATPVFEWIGREEAVVYCFRTSEPLSPRGIEQLLEKLEKTGDISEIGVFRGAYFRVDGAHISVLTAEIVRGLNPERMFPEEGQPPGMNIAELPAPEGRRSLSVQHDGATALTIHQSSRSARASLDAFQQSLLQRGLSVERAEVPDGKALALVTRSPKEAFVVAARDGETGSQVVIARLPH